MFSFQKIQKIQKILYEVDMQNHRVFGDAERGLYRTEAEKIAKELKKSTGLDFIKLSVELIFREKYKDDYIYDPEKISKIGLLIYIIFGKPSLFDSILTKISNCVFENKT